MKYLLDTNIWLWSIDSVGRINQTGLDILRNSSEEVYFSAAAVWEISIKAGLGRLRLPALPAECVPAFMSRQGLRPLPITQFHTVGVYDLPPHHRDPFDRLMIAQAIAEEMVILTSDRVFDKYPVDVVWCGR